MTTTLRMNAILELYVFEASCTHGVMSQSGNAPSIGSAYIISYIGSMAYPVNFEDNPDYDPDAGPGLQSLISAKVCCSMTV